MSSRGGVQGHICPIKSTEALLLVVQKIEVVVVAGASAPATVFTIGLLPRSMLEAGLSMSYSGLPCKNEAQIKLITTL